jgi:hypothetical protein
LKASVSFEEYKRSGEEKYIIGIEERMRLRSVPEKFIEGVKKIDRPLVLLMIGMTYCPDCKVANSSPKPCLSRQFLQRGLRRVYAINGLNLT